MKQEARALWLIYMNMVLIKSYHPTIRQVVFLDGYWHKHYATEAALGIDKTWLKNIGSAFPEPDLTLVIDIDPRRIVERGHKHQPYESGCDFECSDASFIRHQDKVRRILLELADERQYYVLDGDRPAPEIQNEIIDLMQQTLPIDRG